MLKERDGKLSFSRVWCSILLGVYVIYVVICILKNNKFPDIPLQLVGLISALYGVNKFAKD